MIHTYRDQEAAQSTFWGPTLRGLGMLALFAAVGIALTRPAWSGLTRNDAEGLALSFGLLILLVYLAHRHHDYRSCSEIRLSDDGTCELDTKRRVTRLHVKQIQSVLYRRDSESDGEYYRIRYQGGKLSVDERMTDFRDFLIRLKTLNPAVDLSSFPAGAWPGLATPDEARATAQRRGIRGALFPVGVVLLLIWLTVETLR